MRPLSLKEKAINYRKQGYSYNLISKRFKVAKSTLNYWLKDIDFKPNRIVLARIKKAKRKLVEAMVKRCREALKFRKEVKQNAKNDIKEFNKKDLWYLGTILYLAEGNKIQKDVRLTNSDPRVIKLFMRWAKTICKVKSDNFQAAVHIYPDNNEKTAINFWSKLTGIPKSQFRKTQVDRRIKELKFKKKYLPYGTLHIRVRKSGVLFHKIFGWIEGLFEKIT
ncbi:MAG: hypothetical protein COX33_00600 [Candidatus Nealsonbacteria bacterium CG23_combo_of_CG06-09_8_20_14_all_36_125]|uniref:HTH psq-type domain-containing protein n=1 Tax=Candidatus Nealsonbacteria bacterium CG23_combo_of_CG06-09_8_20_14_all_36_125 TaxID=1974719 RepID=A0A2G9YZK6_9BACT|nr:MAG: hypothetical protein COX33_00600 [Candidatus Nealsonbacteria bacterium CG23_combo_of_CG06-09_8_20_14_all_36_125]